jgi:endoglucanase
MEMNDMKKLFILLASTNLLWAAAGGELLSNGDFETGNMNSWFSTIMSPDDAISAEKVGSYTDIYFTLEDGGVENWEVSLMQAIKIRAGYRYTITFGGAGIDENKPVNFGINHNGGTGNGGDGSGSYTTYYSDDVTFTADVYKGFKFVWDDTSITDSKARIFFNGGGNDIDFFLSWASVWESPIDTTSTPSTAAAHYTCLGFFTNGPKRIVIKGATDSTFQIRSASGTVLHNGKLGIPSLWAPSGETVRLADFSSVKTNGTCSLYCSGKPVPGAFKISASPLQALGKAALKAFYYQRVSTPLTSTYAGTWARAAGHPDTVVNVHSSAGSGKISSPKGWYDAGDYGKYIVNCGISVYTLLALYEHFPHYMNSLDLTIPESNNTTPDILDEVRWNLEWMLTMQTADGGVYSKLTSLEFDGTIMSSESNTARYVFMKTTPATLDFAAVMAMSSRLYKTFDASFSATCLEAAKKAYAWATTNPNIKYVQPEDCKTGEYKDDVFTDEFFWASVECALASGTPGDYTYHTTHPLPTGNVPSWPDVGTLGLYTILTNLHAFPSGVVDSCKSRIIATADKLLERQKNGYGISMNTADFYWGSNHVAVSQGIMLLYAFYLTKNNSYLEGTSQQIDYILGRNPLGKSFVTGIGEYSPLHPHHRISEADGIAAPVPGFLVGGPHTGGDDTSWCENYVDKPATSWLDKYCSSATNEVAINWNAPLAYCVNALEALYSGDTVSGFRTITTGRFHHTIVPQRENQLTIVHNENTVVFRSILKSDDETGGIFQLFNASGKLLARIPAATGRYQGERLFMATIPSGKLAKGLLIVQLKMNGSTLQQSFMMQ